VPQKEETELEKCYLRPSSVRRKGKRLHREAYGFFLTSMYIYLRGRLAAGQVLGLVVVVLLLVLLCSTLLIFTTMRDNELKFCTTL
jgi:hypothetical protein